MATKEYRDANKDKIKAYNVEYYRKHKEYENNRNKIYRELHQDSIKIRMALWRQANVVQIKQYMTEYRRINAQALKQYDIDYRKLNTNALAIKWLEYSVLLKLEIFSYYGNGLIKCFLCDEMRLGALHIDHIFGSGAEHRRIISCEGSSNFYSWLKKNEFPNGYRILCANHNWKTYLVKLKKELIQTPAAIKRRQRASKIRLSLLDILGAKCTECGCDDTDVLTIHHLDNDGAEHRRQLVGRNIGGVNYHRKLLKLNNFDRLECLCWSCNDNDYYLSGG